jgi:hypothetical protein
MPRRRADDCACALFISSDAANAASSRVGGEPAGKPAIPVSDPDPDADFDFDFGAPGRSNAPSKLDSSASIRRPQAI